MNLAFEMARGPNVALRRGAAAFGFFLAFVVPPATVAQPAAPPGTAALLADAARDYGLTRRGQPSAADIAHVRALLRASLRLDPRNGDAAEWLYETESLAGDPDAARQALARLCDTDVTNETAFARWVETGPREAQTAERRRTWLETILSQPRPPASLALVHVHLGRLELQRLDRDAARRQLDVARRLFPDTPEIAGLAIGLLTPESPPGERIGALLDAVRFHPGDAERAWQAAVALDEIGFFDDANLLYEHALALHRSANSAAAIPSHKLIRLSLNSLGRSNRDRAGELAIEAVHAAQGTLEPALYLLWLVTTTGVPERVEAIRKVVRDQIEKLPDPQRWPVNLVAQAAWFFSTIPEEAARSLELAQIAAQRAPGDAFVQRVLGWALAANQKNDEARAVLEPLAARDGFAAFKLIELGRSAGRDDAAEVLAKLTFVPPVGPMRELLERVGLPRESRPVTERFPDVVEALKRFDPRVLEFERRATELYSVGLAVEDPRPDSVQPWVVTVALTNRAPHAITLGAGAMLNPVVLLALSVEGSTPRDLPEVLTLSLDRVRVLMPGATVSLKRSIDVGMVRRLSRFSPQQPLRVTVRGVFDPVRSAAGQWLPSATGQYLRPVVIDRTPAQASAAALEARFAALTRADAPERFRAIEILAQLLGEAQRRERDPQEPPAIAVPQERIIHALQAGLLSDAWEVRVRTLDSLMVAGLDATLVEAADKSLLHDHWLVRLMAVRLLARQGRSFSDTAQRIAASDADDLVRDFARSLIDRWAEPPQPVPGGPAASAPASQSHVGKATGP